jgi:HEAT repeat protein
VQRELATALGKIGTAAATAPLQSLLRRSDVRVLQTAVASLAGIDDPAAVRALHTVLRAAAGDARAAVISSLVGLKDPRVTPMLARLLQDSDPFGADNRLVHDALGALATLRDERAVAPIAALAKQRRWMAWGKTTRLREASLRALQRIGSPKAHAALADLANTGDFFLKRQAARAAKAQR